MDTKAYRPDIDGLRAVAVLVVLAFHLDIEHFSGGYVGVDIFFVISGFLITGLILREIRQSGSFRFGRFYMRRVRRLFPALFTVQVATLLTGIWMLSPPHLERLGGALLFSMTSISNIYFWREAGYFDTGAALKPLLHTWSLGVEEQFYLFWPLLLVACARKRWMPPVALVAVGLISFQLNIIFGDGEVAMLGHLPQWFAAPFENGSSTIFFLVPFRVFEFVIGAMLVWGIQFRPKSAWILEPILIIGFIMMGYAVLNYNERTPFPTVNALVPCIGAALAIYAGNARVAGHALRNLVSIYIGKLSYTIYLVHWPLIVYWKYTTLRPLSMNDQLMLTGLSIALAAVIHHLIEQRFRYGAKTQDASQDLRFGLACALATIILIVPAADTWARGGWGWRTPVDLRITKDDATQQIREYWLDGRVIHAPFTEESLSVMVIGDSYALDVAYMLREHPDTEVRYDGTTGHECEAFTLPPSDPEIVSDIDCGMNRQRFEASYPDAEVIVLGDQQSTWDVTSGDHMEEVMRNITLLREGGFEGPIVIYGERPQYDTYVPDLTFRFGRVAGISTFVSEHLRIPPNQMRERVEAATSYYSRSDIYYYSPIPVLCEETTCDVLTPDNKLIYFDKGHFTLAGDRYLADDFVDFLKSLPELQAN